MKQLDRCRWERLLLSVLLAGSAVACAARPPVATPVAASTAPRCDYLAPSAPLPAGYPTRAHAPTSDLSAPAADGSYNWSAAYQLQSMVYHLMETRDPIWAARIVDAAQPLLARRDALSPHDGKPYAWLDRSQAVTAPYAWIGYAGHNFTPLMEFARLVAEDDRLGACVYRGQPLKQHAMAYVREFDRVLDAHAQELVRKDGHSYFVFAHVPSRTARLDGETLPVNMNAAVFAAMLHAAEAQRFLGAAVTAARKRALVRQHVRHLTQSVLQRVPCAGAETCLRWPYASYVERSDDLGHANIVAKFLFDAHEDGYGVPREDLVAFANTLDSLMDREGRFTGNLLDGEKIPGVSEWISYAIVYAGLQDRLRAKIGRVVSGSSEFAYAGAWLRAESERAERLRWRWRG